MQGATLSVRRVSFDPHYNTLKSTNFLSYEPGLSAFLMGCIFGFATVPVIFVINVHFIGLPLSKEGDFFLHQCDSLCASFPLKVILCTVTISSFLYAKTLLSTYKSHKVSHKPRIISRCV